jgi:hypothetical protein
MTNGEYLDAREMRRRIIKAMDALLKDADNHLVRAVTQKHYDRAYSNQYYWEGLMIAKKAILKTMDSL